MNRLTALTQSIFSSPRRTSLILGIAVVIISALAHGYNMFHFPYYENDEAIYLSRAWSLLRQHRITPYTYWYDHAPLGWVQVALWSLLTGGFFTFGFSINSARVFMLIVHIASTTLLYLIGLKLTKSRLAAVASTVFFALSPLAIYYQRRLLLDNLMTFWVLLSLLLILFYRRRLGLMLLSGLAFGIAVLTKETAIFMLPVFLYLVVSLAHSRHNKFAIAQWVGMFGLVVFQYFLYAALKGELLPTGLLDTRERVSLIDTLLFQAGREGGSILNMRQSSFWDNVRVWLVDDPFTTIFGFGVTLANLIIGVKSKPVRYAALLSLSLILYLLRGGIVIEFYLIPLIPFFGLNAALFGWWLGQRLERLSLPAWFPNAAMLSFFAIALPLKSTQVRDHMNIFQTNQTHLQQQAVDWVLSQNHPQAFYVMDNYGYLDLLEKNQGNFAHAHHYWKVEHDPEISEDILQDDPSNIDYFIVSPQLKRDVDSGGFPLVGEALANARPIVSFSDNRWGIEVWGTLYPRRILHATWESYQKEFIRGGRVIDPATDDTTSEGQAYALLRAVQLDDRRTFDRLLRWSNRHLKDDRGLYSWSYQAKRNDPDHTATAPDADQDIAVALLFANYRWQEPDYFEAAEKLIDAIWEHQVDSTGSLPILSSGSWSQRESYVVVNPSYLSPAYYRIFASVDPDHDWEALVNSTYRILDTCTFDLPQAGLQRLPPEWCTINKSTATAITAPVYMPQSADYSYNAIRVPLRVGWDIHWFNSEAGREYLEKLDFLSSTWETENRLLTAYTHTGQPLEEYESVAAYSGALAYFMYTNQNAADKLYQEKILAKFYEDNRHSYWEVPDNYYTQNLAWFATALYTDHYPLYWEL